MIRRGKYCQSRRKLNNLIDLLFVIEIFHTFSCLIQFYSTYIFRGWKYSPMIRSLCVWVKARHVQLREVSEDDNNETDYMMGTVIGSRWFIPGHTWSGDNGPVLLWPLTRFDQDTLKPVSHILGLRSHCCTAAWSFLWSWCCSQYQVSLFEI